MFVVEISGVVVSSLAAYVLKFVDLTANAESFGGLVRKLVVEC